MNRFARTALVTAAAFSAAACNDIVDPPIEAAPHQADVTGGTADGNAHPHVGTLLFVQNGEGYYSCTGTLLSPTVMLTAGHCVESEGNVNDVTYVRFTEDALAGIGDYRSVSAWLRAEWIQARRVVPHPQFDDYSEFPNTYDVGIVILSRAVDLPAYGTLPEIGLLEALASGQDTRTKMFTAVGYGQQGEIRPFYGDDYVREQTTTKLIEVTSTYSGTSQSAKFSNSPGMGSGTGGTCYGDSGGPIFHGTSTVIGAVTSFGFTPCIGNDFNFRIDTRVAQDFILPFLN